jgi:putative aldouronate transport system permease protein
MATTKNRIKRTMGEAIFDVFNTLFMLVIIAVMLFPMIHVLMVSLSSGPESIKGGFYFLPRGGINFAGYQTVFKDPKLVQSYINTIIYSVGGTAFTLFFTSMTAYPLSIPNFRLRKFVTVFLVITMFFGGGMIPTYLLMRDIGFINTRWVMIIPFCVGAYNVVLFRTFFSGLPPELREAAKIDGASELSIYVRIIVPLSKAIFATIALFTFVGKWNEWFAALLYMNEERMQPVQMILRKILFNVSAMAGMDANIRSQISDSTLSGQNIKMAAIIITTLPILCIYPFIQKYFVKGVFVGTIKG